jgi:peptidyl-tRNA hydrolase, PTH1 family
MQLISPKPDQLENAAFLIVGLGNPGREHKENRHNIGFMLIDSLAKAFNTRTSKVQTKSLIAVVNHTGQRLILAKPQTFMNLSGQAVSSLLRFYKVPIGNLLVAHDDLDLPLGTLRLRPGGGSAGQKRMGSIIERLGTQDFARLRLGIGRPPGRMEPADYVLQDFSSSEKELLSQVLERATQAAQTFIESGIEKAMNQFNGALIAE